MRMMEKWADLLFPPALYCDCCGKYIDKTRTYSLCDHCIRRMNFSATDLSQEENMDCFKHAIGVMGYGLYEKQLILSLKYGGKTYLARTMADIIYDSMTEAFFVKGEKWCFKSELIIPVPIHPLRLKERGFNQSEKIGFYLGKKLGVGVLGDALLRVKNTEAQRSLSPQDRKVNLEGAFCINERKKSLVEGKRVLLIDDIYTTGATASRCGEILKAAGASEVDFIAFSSAKNKHHEFYACKD